MPLALKSVGAVKRNPWLLSDEIWKRIEPLLPEQPERDPAIGGRPRVSNREAMNGIFFVLRTGCQWNALNATGICTSSTAHRRFQEWTEQGVFEKLWVNGLEKYDEVKGIKWRWQSMDGAMTKAPLGGEKNRTQSNRSSKARRQTKSAV
jgi:transposase